MLEVTFHIFTFIDIKLCIFKAYDSKFWYTSALWSHPYYQATTAQIPFLLFFCGEDTYDELS